MLFKNFQKNSFFIKLFKLNHMCYSNSFDESLLFFYLEKQRVKSIYLKNEIFGNYSVFF